MKIPSNVCVLVADYGVGDHYLVAAFAGAIRRQYGVRTWMAGREDMVFVHRLFPAVEQYLHWPKGADRAVLFKERIEGGKLFDAHFPGLELMRAVGYRDFHFLDAYRCRFGLPAETPLDRASLPKPEELSSVAALLQEAGVPVGHFVLLGIDARTTPTDGVTMEFWQELGQRLREAGLVPVVNAAPGTKLPENMLSIAPPLHALRAIVQCSAGVCTVRSGLSDLFHDLPRPQVVVYPEARYWAGSLRQGTTLKPYGGGGPLLEVTATANRAVATAAEVADMLIRNAVAVAA